jgi:hypothetical protein
MIPKKPASDQLRGRRRFSDEMWRQPKPGSGAMLDYLQKAKQYLWAFVEIGFLTVLSVILIYLILGPDSSGVFVSGVADNVLKFAAALPAQSLVGLAIVLALVILLSNRLR